MTYMRVLFIIEKEVCLSAQRHVMIMREGGTY
jgi:hypothetical protein